ncbi:MAG: glycerophosphodiester phosphodiesterase [Pseudonocardiaceae bacterium]
MRTTGSGHRASISAHRGGSEDALAGTLAAYQSAAGTGAEYVEFDIRRTSDDVYVVYHEDRANHVGPLLSELTYDELCREVGYSAPKVAEVMKIIACTAIGHLDLKQVGREREVIEMALDIFGQGNFVATTLEDVSVAAIKHDFPYVRTALSLGRDMAGKGHLLTARTRMSELLPLSRIRNCGADWVAVNHKLAKLGVLRLCKANDIGVMVWTVNDDKRIKRLLADDRVDVLITDHPRRAVGIRSALSDYRP